MHVSNNGSNTDYDPQDIPLHWRMVNKIGYELEYRKLKSSEKLLIEMSKIELTLNLSS